MANISDMFVGESYLLVNRNLIKTFGLDIAVFFSALCSKYAECSKKGTLHYGMFTYPLEDVKSDIGLSYHMQAKATQALEKAGLISVSVEGMPATKYYIVNQAQVLKWCYNNTFEDNA